jgi:hypothetical protein
MIVARKALAAIFIACAMPAAAEDRVALVIASESGAAPTDAARKDTLALSEMLFGMGFTVKRLENPDAAALTSAIAALPADATALLYFSGSAVVTEDRTHLMTGPAPVPLDATLTALQGDRAETLVFLDTCGAGAVPLPAPTDLPGLFVALPTAPGADCPADAPGMAQLMLERITAPGQGLTEQFPATPADAAAAPGLWVRSTLPQPFVFRAATSATQLTAADYDMLEQLSPEDRDRMVKLWTDAGIAVDIARPAPGGVTARVEETVVVISPVQPLAIETASVLSPITTAVSPILTGTEVQGEELAVLVATPVIAAPTPARAQPVPRAGGLPQPSVILGETATLAALATPAPDQLLDYTDIAARQALKASDAAEYERLILTGAYDPPPEQMAIAVQTELARMNCYTTTIDGDWGNGSRRALQRYFDTLEVAAPSQDPTVDIFRQLLQKDDVECPEVAAPAPQPAAAAAPRTTQRQTAPAQAAPAPQPAAPAPTDGRRIRQTSGTGAFR